MLYHPFKRVADLLSFDGSDYGSYPDAFRACRRLYTHLDDFYTDLVADDQDTESEDNESVRNESGDEPLTNFKLFARRRPRDDLTCSFTDDLGSRDLDRVYD